MKKLIIVLTFLAVPLSSYAQDAFYVSGMLGLGKLNVNNSTIDYNTELTYGLRAGLLFNDHVSAGLYLQRYKTDYTSGIKFEFTIDNIMAEVTYYFKEADENTFWLSGLLGKTKGKITSALGSPSETDTSFGFSAGYQFAVAPNWSLSPQITYIMTNGDPNNYSEFSALANLTVWL